MINKWNSINDQLRPKRGTKVWLAQETKNFRVVEGFYSPYYNSETGERLYEWTDPNGIEYKNDDNITHWMSYFTPEPPPHSNPGNYVKLDQDF